MTSLEKLIASKLKGLNKTLSVAESCTGGSICSKIVSTQGASVFFQGGVVCYSTESKINILNKNWFCEISKIYIFATIQFWGYIL